METIEQKRCSRREARAAIAERSRGYANATNRSNNITDSSLSEVIASTVEKTMTRIMENLFVTLTESLAQIVNAQMTQILMSVNQPEGTPLLSSTKEVNTGSQEPVSLKTSRTKIAPDGEQLYSPKPGPSNTSRKIIPVEQELEWSSDSSSLDSQMETESRNMKRRASPRKQGSPGSPKGKSKKYKEIASKNDFLKDSILDKAVNAAGISSK